MIFYHFFIVLILVKILVTLYCLSFHLLHTRGIFYVMCHIFFHDNYKTFFAYQNFNLIYFHLM